MMQAWSEQALLLGERRSLVGIATKPAASVDTDRPTVVILNSGIVHRVGANRMSVHLSRALAAAGYSAVRFDLSGIGDSEPRPDALAPLDAALADIREALDSLEPSRKKAKFLLVGLCSGANHSVIYAGSDTRVVGTVLLEPAIPPPLRHHLHYYRRRIFRLQTWLHVVRGNNALLRSLKKRITGALERSPAPATTSEEPRQPKITGAEVRAFWENAYRRVLDRGIPFMVVLTGESWYYRETFFDAFPRLKFGKNVRLEYLEDADHVFSSRASARAVTRLILEWTDHTLPSGNSHGA